MAIKLPLSPLEQRVMNAIWARTRATASEIQAALARHRELKDSTVRTLLTRLEEKGYVRHEVEGRTYVYSSVEAPQRVAVRAVKQIVDRFCQGSMESLLAGMVDEEMVDPEELQAIAERLAREEGEKPRAVEKRRGKR